MKKPILIISLALFLLITAAISGGFYFINQFSHKRPTEISHEIIYELQSGNSFLSIANELEKLNVVTHAQLFSWYAKIKGQRSQIKAGEYLLNTNMTPDLVLQIITSGKSIEKPFTIAEGLNIFEIADLIEKTGKATKEEFLSLVKDKDFIQQVLGEEVETLEGYLFPETYMINKKTTIKDLIQQMVKRHKLVFAEVYQNQNDMTIPLSKKEIIILASIVEKETGASSERPTIASVFYNRLSKKMRLQTDPTIIYGKALNTGKYEINISRQDLTEENSYNTYVIPGLPPGPIANPGKEAILAVLRPAQTDYLFFVSKNDGTHVFSTDLKNHTNAVNQFQKDARAREGKSWRQLKK